MFSLVLCFVLISFVFVCVFCLLCLALCASFRFVETEVYSQTNGLVTGILQNIIFHVPHNKDIQSIQVWNDEKVNE